MKPSIVIKAPASGKSMARPSVQSGRYCVEEIDMPKGDPVYIVEIQDKRSIKKLRVDKEEIEVIRDLVKP